MAALAGTVMPRFVTGSLLPVQNVRSFPMPPGWNERPPPVPTTDRSLLVEATTTPGGGSFALAAASSKSYRLDSINSSTRFQPTTAPSASPTAMCDNVGETASDETGDGRPGVGEIGAERTKVRWGEVAASAKGWPIAEADDEGGGSVRSHTLRIGNKDADSSCGAKSALQGSGLDNKKAIRTHADCYDDGASLHGIPFPRVDQVHSGIVASPALFEFPLFVDPADAALEVGDEYDAVRTDERVRMNARGEPRLIDPFRSG